MNHYLEKEYRWTPSGYVAADFPYDSYRGQWVSMRITLKNNKIYYFVNGNLVGSGAFTKPTANDFYIKSAQSLSSISSYDPADSPYDTNKVLALPDTLAANTIYVQSSTTVNGHRVGGVRPSNPSNGFFYVPLYSDYTTAQPQMYVNGNWISVSAVVYNGTSRKDVLGFKFSPPGSCPDAEPDITPGHPDKPSVDPNKCDHDWKESSRTDSACETAGKIVYTCPLCKKTREEVIAALEHIYTETKQIPATCTATGSVTYTYTRWNKTKTDGISALGHDYVEQNRVAATCEADGFIRFICSRCT